MPKTIIDFHLIQTVPPSCVNRDDTGSPKTAVYGGVRRARVSSQSWKRAIREVFAAKLDRSQLGWRTKRVAELIAKEIVAVNPSLKLEEALKKAAGVLQEAGLKLSGAQETQALFFISHTQITKLADLAMKEHDKKVAKQVLQGAGDAIDIALFGRMVADDPGLNADASAQVAHAISVHKVENEYDYFTAVDDVKHQDTESTDAGAGMIGTVEFNSATYYRFATVHADLLFQELSSDAPATAEAVAAFTDAFISSMPTGKMNTFANQTLPSAVMVTIRPDQSVNLVGAFEEAIKQADNKITAQASEKLATYAGSIYQNYVNAPDKTYVLTVDGAGDKLASLGEKVTLDKLLSNLKQEVINRLS